MLRHFDPKKPARVETDASGFAEGGILSQPFKNAEGKLLWHPIAYVSRKLSATEGVYETHDKELLAIVEMFKRWRHYLQEVEQTTEVWYDHNNLKYFMATTVLNGRQARWALDLSKYDFEIKYRPGKTNPQDPLSRRPDHRTLAENGVKKYLKVERTQRKKATSETLGRRLGLGYHLIALLDSQNRI
jgi:RNase H-like domain found in reverse transcriptase